MLDLIAARDSVFGHLHARKSQLEAIDPAVILVWFGQPIVELKNTTATEIQVKLVPVTRYKARFVVAQVDSSLRRDREEGYVQLEVRISVASPNAYTKCLTIADKLMGIYRNQSTIEGIRFKDASTRDISVVGGTEYKYLIFIAYSN